MENELCEKICGNCAYMECWFGDCWCHKHLDEKGEVTECPKEFYCEEWEED